jgi:outer membrane immunogenic protein
MKRLLLAVVAGLALTTSAALAADLYVPAPAVAPTAPAVVLPLPVPTWTGFYLGINGGLATDRFLLPWTAGVWSGSSGVNMDRGIGGVQAGYNWQIAPRWIVGLEADFDASDIVKVSDYSTIIDGSGTLNLGANLDWFGTVRPRVGFAVTPSAFVYLTGGFAYGHASFSVTSPTGTTTSASSDKIGWTSGAGLEYALTDWVSVKTEYLYLDLGSNSFPSGTALTISGQMIAHTLKAGLNFKLGPWDVH